MCTNSPRLPAIARSGRSRLLVAVLASLLVAGPGCHTTTVEQTTDYKLSSARPDSILDAELTNHWEELKKYPKRDDLYYKIAGIHWQKGELREASAALRDALRLVPDNPKYRLRLGQAYCMMRELDLAEEEFREVIRLLPPGRYSGPHAALGFVLDMKKDTDGAIEQFKQCVAIEPANTDYYYALASLQDIRGERDDAVQNFQEYLVRGGNKYRRKAIFFLEKLGVKVEHLPPPSAEDRTEAESMLLGRKFEWNDTPEPDAADLPEGATPAPSNAATAGPTAGE